MFEQTLAALKQKLTALAETYKQVRTEKVAQIQQQKNGVPADAPVKAGTDAPAAVGAEAKEITASVGKGGVNNSADVLLVQQLLNKKGVSVSEDGKIGNNTINAIITFQKAAFPGWDGDGLITPGKNTWKKLAEAGTVPAPADNNTPPANNPPATEDTGSYSYYHHADWEKAKYTLSSGRTSKPLNATADRLLRAILAGGKITGARVTSTWRNYADQAYCILTQVSESEALGWYSYVSKHKDVYYKYKKMLGTTDAETVFKEYGAWIEKNVGLGASNHLSGIALDIAGCDLGAFNKFAGTLVGKSGSGVKKVFPEPGRTHLEFTFQVCNIGNVSTGGTGEGVTPPANNNTTPPAADTNNGTTPPAAPAAKEITASVGKDGVNNSADVLLVQQLLNKKGASVSEDGKIGNNTINAIIAFQKSAFPGWDGDGLITPGKNTWKKLVETGTAPAPADNNTPPANNPPAAGEVTPGNEGESGKEVYLDQRDNPVLGDKTCNVTTLAMQLSSLAGGDVSRVQQMAATLLKGYGVNINPNTALEEMLRQLTVKVAGFESQDGIPAWQWAWVLDNTSEKFKELVSKTVFVENVLTQAKYMSDILPAVQQGAEVMLSNKLTSGGHIAFLLAVRSDGIVINDPYGLMSGDQKYIRNGDPVSSHAAKYKDYAATIATRLKYNSSLKAEMDALFQSGTGTLPRKLGAKNFYTWAEVATYKIGKWCNVTYKK